MKATLVPAGLAIVAICALLHAPPDMRADVLYVSGSPIIKFASDGQRSTFGSTTWSESQAMAFDRNGNLYASSYNGASSGIEKFTPAGVRSVFATSGLGGPYGLAFDGEGNLYAANYLSGRSWIERFTPDGARSLFAETGSSVIIGLAFDRAGDLYVANYTSSTIEKFTPDGVGSVFADAGLGSPLGLAFDSAGNLYAANQGNGLNSWIEKFTPSGVGSVFATTGSSGPDGLAFDSTGNLYVVNNYRSTIEKFTPEGIGSIFANFPNPLAIALTDDDGHPLLLQPRPSNQPPVARCADVMVSAGSDCQANASVDIGSYDPDGDVIVLTQSPPGPYPLGTNIVTLTVTDSHGDLDSCSAEVIVIDTTPPAIVSVVADPSLLWPPNHQMVAVDMSATVTDNCGPAAWKIIGVLCNEPAREPSHDWLITNEHQVLLRSERLGTGAGRIYSIMVQATDASGNLSDTRLVTVAVPKSLGNRK